MTLLEIYFRSQKHEKRHIERNEYIGNMVGFIHPYFFIHNFQSYLTGILQG